MRLEAEQELCRLQSCLANLTAHGLTRPEDRSQSKRSSFTPSPLISIHSEERPSKDNPVKAARQPPPAANAVHASLSTSRSESSAPRSTPLEDLLVHCFHQTPWVNALEEYKKEIETEMWIRAHKGLASVQTAHQTPRDKNLPLRRIHLTDVFLLQSSLKTASRRSTSLISPTETRLGLTTCRCSSS